MISVVTPVHDEEGWLAALVDEVFAALHDRPFELVCVDDASTDASYAVLQALAADRPWLRVLRLAANAGQTAAIAAGIHAAHGQVMLLMDSDGQNDPADIPALLVRLESGYDVVSGQRANRSEPFTRRLVSSAANRVLRGVSGVSLRDSGCSLKAYRVEVLRDVTLLRDDHRFLPALAGGLGARVCEVDVHDRPRACTSAAAGAQSHPLASPRTCSAYGSYCASAAARLRAFTWLGVAAAAWWTGLAVLLLVISGPAFGIVSLGVAVALCCVGSCAYGASLEMTRRTDGRGLYRLRDPEPRPLATLAPGSRWAAVSSLRRSPFPIDRGSPIRARRQVEFRLDATVTTS